MVPSPRWRLRAHGSVSSTSAAGLCIAASSTAGLPSSDAVHDGVPALTVSSGHLLPHAQHKQRRPCICCL